MCVGAVCLCTIVCRSSLHFVCRGLGAELAWKLFPRKLSCFSFPIKINIWVLRKGLELLGANVGSSELNQPLFADDTALVADSEEKLCILVSEFGRVYKRRKLRVNVGKSKVMSARDMETGVRCM